MSKPAYRNRFLTFESVALFLLAPLSFGNPGYRFLVPLVVAAVVLASIRGWEIRPHSWWLPGLGLVLGAAIGAPWYPQATAYRLATLALSILALVLISIPSLRRGYVVAGVGLLTLVVFITTLPDGFLDVGVMHHQASAALMEGRSPWEGLSAGVGGSITGYLYPPAVLLTYTLARFITGDPMTAGWMLWAVLLGVCVFRGHRASSPPAAYLIALAASYPLMVWTGWTELLTVALLGVAAVTGPLTGAIALGAALATKQYLVSLGPIAVAYFLRQPRRYLWIGLGLPVVLTASGFLMGSGYLDALIGYHGRTEARPDSYTLFAAFGAPFDAPTWMGLFAVCAAMVVSAILAFRGIPDFPALARSSALVLTVFMALSPFAHANHWFIVWGLILVARMVPARQYPPEQVALISQNPSSV